MRNLLTLILFVLSAISAGAQTKNLNYNAKLAETLGADEYGMKSYVMVILKTGSNKTSDKAFIDSCFSGHMDNISRMADAHKLIVAGPMGKNENSVRGIFILDVATFEEAKELLKSDAAVNANILAADYYIWYGSAALPQYLEYDDQIWQLKP